MNNRLPDAFAKNRNEEFKEDNWADFVVPPFLNKLDLKSQSKAFVIMGGRGCGKTTLLRYFCHATQFSCKREDVSDALEHIGLYWRADTNFLNAFAGGEQSAETWRAAFEHLLTCEIGRELIRSLRNLNCNKDRQDKYGGIENLDLSLLQDFDSEIGSNLVELERYLQRGRNQLAMWLNNLDSYKKPTFLSADLFLRAFVSLLKNQLPYLQGSTFAIFIDEYENLRDEQQQFINGLLKHGSPPLLYNIAMKRNGWHTTRTIGRESIQNISDYRIIDLEEYLESDFDLFAAELIFFRLAEHNPEIESQLPIVPANLRSVMMVEKRYKDEAYKQSVIGAAERMLPRVNERAAAKEILSNTKLRDKLIDKIRSALAKRQEVLEATDFIDDDYPEASVVMPALLNRPRESPNDLLRELDKLRNSEQCRLLPNGALVNNYLFGCVNSIYLDSRKNSILFSGFTTLTLLSKGNIRHLLELIHRIYKVNPVDVCDGLPVVPPEVQASAVRDASESILGTVSGHGTFGPQLHALATCLGSIFRERHRSAKQSEPEINHFTIASGDETTALHRYLQEAEKWSVLFVSPETKMKNTGALSLEYVLNPVFAPYFQISFRKKRSMQVTAAQVLSMFEGDQFARDSLVRELGRKEPVEIGNMDLFEENQ